MLNKDISSQKIFRTLRRSIVCLAILGTAPFEAAAIDSSRLYSMEGIVEVLASPSDGWKPAALNMILDSGSAICKVLPRVICDPTRIGAGSREVVVVKGQQNSIRSGVHVGFNVAVSQVNRVLEGSHGVLGRRRSPSTVGEGDRTVVVEKRMERHRRVRPAQIERPAAFQYSSFSRRL